MMKTFRMKYTVLFVLVLAFFTACASDGADPENSGGEAKAGNLTVHMTLSTASPSTSRATTSWTDGTDAENMKSWVVAFVQDGKVVAFEEKTSVDADKRITDDVTITGLSAGKYEVYSFANLSASELGISKNANVDFDTKEWKMEGNGYDTSTKGIPMSNKQEVTVSSDGSLSTNTLWVVRMLAKVTLKFKNPTTTALTINDITINDITQNPDASSSSSEANIMLLPKHSNANSDEVACEPNLASTAKVGSYTYSLSSPVTVAANTNDYTEVSFYVNESVAGNTSKYFIVNLNTSSGVKRYALFKDWTTIARNDHHILPITLDDYKLKFDVEAYSAIGLYPSVTDNGTTLSYTCYYPEEEFHIKPMVVKGYDTEISETIDNTKIKWELIQEDDMADETAVQTNALKVFKTLPTWNSTAGLFEGTFNDDAADKQSALYKLTVPINDTKSLEYKVLFTKDLTTFAARKHYTRKFYRYE